MKNLFTLFLTIVILLACHACQQEDEDRWPPDDKRILEVFVYYRQGNEMRVDYGAKIYLYYDCDGLYNLIDFDEYWKSHSTLTLLAKQDCPLWLQYD